MKWYWIVLIVLGALIIGYFIPKLMAMVSPSTTATSVVAAPPVGSSVAVTTDPATGAKRIRVA
jgi:bacteriorhodopsin